MKRTFLLAGIILLILGSSTAAFDGNRKGFVLGGGLGLSPTAKLSNGGSESWSGLASNFLIGYAWDENNMIVFMRDAAWHNVEIDRGETELVAQGFAGVVYRRYFGEVGRTGFVTGGIGLTDFTFISSDFDSPDAGFGILIGGGYEFARHVEVRGSYSFGTVAELGYDYNVSQFTITLSAVAF